MAALAFAGQSMVTGQEPQAREVDSKTGLEVAPDLDLIKATCLECHSPRLILQARASREQWIGMIRWMQETQGLEELREEDEERILAYLTANYGVEERRHRRSPLPEEQLPPPGEI